MKELSKNEYQEIEDYFVGTRFDYYFKCPRCDDVLIPVYTEVDRKNKKAEWVTCFLCGEEYDLHDQKCLHIALTKLNILRDKVERGRIQGISFDETQMLKRLVGV